MKNDSAEKELEYTKIFKNIVADDLKSYEGDRKKLVAKILICWLFFVFILCFSAQNFLRGDIALVLQGITALMVAVLVAVLSFCYTFTTTRAFLVNLKKDNLPKLLEIFGGIKWHERITSSLQALISYDTLQKSELFFATGEWTCDDQFEGQHCGINYKVAEINLIHAFKGIVLLFNINKKIKGRTTVVTKGDTSDKHSWLVYPLILTLMFIFLIPMLLHSLFVAEDYFASFLIFLYFAGFIYVGIEFVSKWHKKKQDGMTNKIFLEDPKFNKRFIAYSSDEIEGRYLLTPAFMERFQNLKTAFGAKNIKCSFFDDQLMIAISTRKNLFELGSVWKSLLKTDFAKEFYNEITSILAMVEHFKLDEKTGL